MASGGGVITEESGRGSTAWRRRGRRGRGALRMI